MEIALPWGEDSLHVHLSDTWDVHLLTPPEDTDMPAGDELQIVREALEAPVETVPLSSRDLTGQRILIIVDDNTRPTPVSRFFHLILEALERAGAGMTNIRVLTALGIHTAMSGAEMAEKIGADNLSGISWSNHDAFDPAIHRRLGTTSFGTPVDLNHQVAESDLVILVGLIEPHLWAGFGGGLKTLFPGVASARAIGMHHGRIADPPYRFNRVGMSPEDNSFRRDLEEVRRFVPADFFCLNVTLNSRSEINAAFAGDPVECHRRGAAFCTAHAGVPMAEPVDAVVVNAHPMDLNFKQSMKCVANALPALKPGGTVMAFLRAERGLDDIPLPDKPPPLPVLKAILRAAGKSNVLRLLELTKKNLNVEEKFLNYYSMRLIREHRLLFYVPVLSSEEIRHLGFFKPCATPQSVIDEGSRKLKKRARVAVFPTGGATFPVMTSERGRPEPDVSD